MRQELTKTDVARRQLVSAIRLFFDDRDPVSVFSLAANAWEIINALCEIEDVDSLSRQTQSSLEDGKSLKFDFINNPFRNFFKHADKDPHGRLVGFSDRQNDEVLMLAAEDYIRLVNKSPAEFQVFQLWYLALNDKRIASDALERTMPLIRQAFPGIKVLSRIEQKKMGRAWLMEAINDQEFLNDPRTDTSEIHIWNSVSSNQEVRGA